MSDPHYQNISSDHIPEIRHNDGVNVRVIAGEVDGVRGPVKEIAAEPTYLDISIPPGGTFSQPIARGHAAFAYVFEGEGIFEDGDAEAGKPISRLHWAPKSTGSSV